MDSCEKFCYKYLNKSIHELFFGVSKATPLPRHLNFLGQELDRLSDAGSDGAYELCSLYILCKEIFDRDENKFQNSLDTPVVEGAAFAICRERLYEMADGVFSIPEEALGVSYRPMSAPGYGKYSTVRKQMVRRLLSCTWQ